MCKLKSLKGTSLKSSSQVFLCTLFIFLTSCTVIPGTHISKLDTSDASFSKNNDIDLIPITQDLINKMQSEEVKIESAINRSLQDEMNNYTYLVGVGDVLNIIVWDHPELTIPQSGNRPAAEAGNFVHKDGTIFYPYVGKVSVTGREVTEIREDIAKGLSTYINNPQVDVNVAAFRSQHFFVSGAVKNPQMIPVRNVPITILDALSISGGMAPDADWSSATLTSTSKGVLVTETIDLSILLEQGVLKQNRLLKFNDVLHIPRNDALKVFVMGDVANASTQQIGRRGMTLAEALNNAGGINEASANASGIFVLRLNDSALKLVDIYQLDVSMGPRLILSTQFKLQPKDIVYVTSAPVARWNKLLAQLTSSLNQIYQIDRIENRY
ncbi:polysaccharide export protein [Gammaproteobacteria bacterium]|nr:polysaccharide export protein [Gammaproteobacteria bacterium]MDA9010719.1 polysaccharide export protein [Gammaproteobacteria bacterium]